RGVCACVLEEQLSCCADKPDDMLAWLVPDIGPRSLEVGGEVREAFMAVDANASAAVIQHGDKYLADIYQLARQRLANVGVEQIFGGDRCTYTENETFFSYRRDKTTCRMASFIWLI
ncbi:laccase domain-containing protein, partial [Escherichia coli]|nr:laccase domain-containing protein [Escherichia coli]